MRGDGSEADSRDKIVERCIPSTTSDCQVPQQSTLATWPVDVDAADFSRLGSEEWDTGDDELVPETLDGEVGIHIEGNPDDVPSGLCPICDINAGDSVYTSPFVGRQRPFGTCTVGTFERPRNMSFTLPLGESK